MGRAAARCLSLGRQGLHAEAAVELRRALEIREVVFAADHPEVLRSQLNLGEAEVELGHHRQGAALAERAVQGLARLEPPQAELLAEARYWLARALWDTDRERAQVLVQQAIERHPEEVRREAIAAWLRTASSESRPSPSPSRDE